MDEVWTIKRALDWTEGYLGRKGDENPRVSAQWLMSAATGLSRVELYMRFEQPLSSDERTVLREAVRRRGAGEPLQYITGETGFRHITLKVRPGVLIPRPETEVLVSEALALLPERDHSACLPWGSAWGGEGERDAAIGFDASDAQEVGQSIPMADEGHRVLLAADICTGSGCIACSLACERDDVQVVATDIAPDAVRLARENAETLGFAQRVEVIECDVGAGIDASLLGSFDLVVSNPPYVPSDVLDGIPREVADFEPALALDGGTDGLAVYRRILEFSRAALRPGGGLAVELHETCLEEAMRLAQKAGFEHCAIVNDLAGRQRVLTARLP